jgi:hypothetical protein
MSYLLSNVIAASLAFSSLAVTQPALKKSDAAQPAKKTESFKCFTGKITANKVRIRAKPDIESRIIHQVNKNDLLLVVGESGDFWAIQPPQGTKAYVFRSYVLDDVIEANRVNVRLEPHIDAPIIAQLQAGDRVQSQICAMNHKWLEIAPPANACFYVSKEYVDKAGGPEYLSAVEKRKKEAADLLNSAFILSEVECKKSYDQMSIQDAVEKFQAVIHSYIDFPEAVQAAKEGLTALRDAFLQKKITYLEAKTELSESVKEELLAKHQTEKCDLFDTSLHSTKSKPDHFKNDQAGRLHFWDTIEESLYLSWAAFHTSKKMDEFYQEQLANATVISGKIQSYEHPVRNRPGDFILMGDNTPVAFIYSTHVNLEQFIGKNITMLASPRPNNHFAFPAYFVLSVE